MTNQTPDTPEPSPAPRESKGGPARAATLAPETVKPKKKLFGGDSKAGRALRRVIRAIAFIVGFFGLGFFVTYLLLYRPLEVRYKLNQVELTQVQQQLEQAQADLRLAQQNSQQTATENDQLSSGQDKLRAQVVVLQTLNELGQVNLALASQDSAAARLALDEAEKLLDASMAQLEELGAAQADTITQLFTLVRNDLERDVHLAQQDLDRLNSELLLINETLAK